MVPPGFSVRWLGDAIIRARYPVFAHAAGFKIQTFQHGGGQFGMNEFSEPVACRR